MSFEQESELDVIAESSPETEQQTEQSTQAEPNSEQDAQGAQSEQKSGDNVPFHMHPRFQEIVADRRQLKEQVQQQAALLAELQKQVKSASPAERDELMERLEGIDPKFAGMLKGMREEIKTARQQLEEFQNWKQQSSAQTVAQRVDGMKSAFYSEHKVPEDRKDLYEAMVSNIAASNPQLSIDDLPKVMKQAHERISSLLQSVERNANKELVEKKKADAARPATQVKGGAPKVKQEDEQPMTKAEIRAAMKAEVLKEGRSGQDI